MQKWQAMANKDILVLSKKAKILEEKREAKRKE